jgi:beta-galactosidase/beta-glucuronidase
MVPGDINDDLETAKLLPDLWFADNAKEQPWWVPVSEWSYQANISVPTTWPGSSVAIRFDGVDYNCSVIVNNQTVGRHAGSFLPFEFDITDAISRSSSAMFTLEVVLHPPPSALISALYNGSTPAYGVDQCLENKLFPLWKSRLNQWDFAPKMWQLGIWRDVSLQISKGVSMPPFPLKVGWTKLVPPYRTAHLSLAATLALVARSLPTAHSMTNVTMAWTIECVTDPSAPSVAFNSSHTLLPGSSTVSADVQLSSPRLWWPNGYGEQHLYRLNATLFVHSAHGLQHGRSLVHSAEASTRFGVRHLQNLKNPLVDGSSWWSYNQYEQNCGPCLLNSSQYPSSTPAYLDKDRWLISVNGRKIFAAGANWVPSDMMYGRAVRNKSRLRALVTMARAAHYTFVRVWGGGMVEEQYFYDLCDEFGIMVQQDFPLAGCGYSKRNHSWDWLDAPSAALSAGSPPGPSILQALKSQVPLVLDQLSNHPSVVRYSLANEFYLNRTYCPVEAVWEDAVNAVEGMASTVWAGEGSGRLARQADPTNIGQRHGPYHFDIMGGAGYDSWGGKWDRPGSCSSANIRTSASCCPDPLVPIDTAGAPAGCRYSRTDGGPGDPFEWSEFGANAISDLETLSAVLPPESLAVSAVGDAMWGFHKAGMWLDRSVWEPLFVPPPTPPPTPRASCTFLSDVDYHPQTAYHTTSAASEEACCAKCEADHPKCVVAVLYAGRCYFKSVQESAGGKYSRPGRVACLPRNGSISSAAEGPVTVNGFDSLADVVRASQFTQAEAYRFAYQAGRRRKWHRSLMASWTFDEPWPNCAHGSVVDYYGRPKHAFYAVRAALATVDVSLSYSDITIAASTQEHSTSTSTIPAMVFVDSNMAEPLVGVDVLIEYFTPHASPSLPFAPSKEHIATNITVDPSAVTNLGKLNFMPPASLVGQVLILRLSMHQGANLLARHDYTFGVTAGTRSGSNSTDAPLASLLAAPRIKLKINATSTSTSGKLAVSVATAGAGETCAVFVKLTLRDARTQATVPYAVFSSNYVILRPEETLISDINEMGTPGPSKSGLVVCAEAWNALQVCTDLITSRGA